MALTEADRAYRAKHAKALAKIAAAGIGPRKVGGRYLCGYTREAYTVLAVEETRDDWMNWSVTVATDAELESGTSRTHCTRWDPRRDRVISQPS